MTVQKGGWDFFQEGKAGMGDSSDNAVTDPAGNPAIYTIIGDNTADSVQGPVRAQAMFPDNATPVDTNANEVWLNEAGCTGFWVEPAEAMAATQVLLVAASTSYDDNDNLAFILDQAAADYNAATPTALPFEVMVVSTIDKLPRMMLWDGVNTIKTISMRWAGINGGAVTETYTVTLNTLEAAA